MHNQVLRARNFTFRMYERTFDEKSYFDIVEVSRHLKMLAKSNDVKSFSKLISAYDAFCFKKGLDFGYVLSFLEWVCMGLDHGFENIPRFSLGGDYDSTRAFPMGEIQKFFSILYGICLHGNQQIYITKK